MIKVKVADPIARAHLGYLTYDPLGYATLGFLFRTSTESSLLIKFCLYLVEKQKEVNIQTFIQNKVLIRNRKTKLEEIIVKRQAYLKVENKLNQLASITATKQNKPMIMAYIENCDTP